MQAFLACLLSVHLITFVILFLVVKHQRYSTHGTRQMREYVKEPAVHLGGRKKKLVLNCNSKFKSKTSCSENFIALYDF